MSAPVDTSPQEFGQALSRLREETGVSLEAITTRTKIARRALEALEAGEYGLLPDRVFGGYFLRQYLDFLGVEDKEGWLQGFEKTWEFHLRSSQPVLPVQNPPPPARRPIGPWLVGLIFVLVALVAVIVIERKQVERNGVNGLPTLPTPVTGESVGVSTPSADAHVAVVRDPAGPIPSDPETVLRVRALDRACWVEVVPGEELPRSRLLQADEDWEVVVGRGPVEVLVGDAGAVEFTIRGQTLQRPGRSGQVLRFRFPGVETEEPEVR